VRSDRPDIRLPRSDRSPLTHLLTRVLIALGLIVFVAMVAYLDRDGYRDANETPIGLIDAFYYSTVSVTTTGYGDITPATDQARLISTLLVTPARILFLIILVGTTLEVLAERTRTHYREKLWRRTLRNHIIVCGYGVKGQAAVATILAHGDHAHDEIVVIDERPTPGWSRTPARRPRSRRPAWRRRRRSSSPPTATTPRCSSRSPPAS
jgi:voltage-gated potassium channel